jgi:hypothetical protein
MMVIDNKFEIGQTVYLTTDQEQLPRMVYGYEITQGSIIYMLCVGTTSSKHFDFEITETVDALKKIDN